MNQVTEAVTPPPAAVPHEGHVHRDDFGSKIGIWLFLFTEIILFGGMFLLYASYRYIYPDGFEAAAIELDTYLGAVNTIILLTSSLTVVLSITALQKNNTRLCLFFLWFTIICGLAFLVNKYFEWGVKFEHGLYPGGEEMVNLSDGEIIFFGLYYVMTGLHALHIVVGLLFLGFIIYFIHRGWTTSTNHQKFENAGLYWHLVDIIWIFLFPLFYLLH
jgi:cytochrome c oxidase subunit III